jgi:hypothetical protein
MTCTSCQRDNLTASDYYVSNKSHCKTCLKERTRAYYRAHREECIAHEMAYQRSHKDAHTRATLRWRKKHIISQMI